MRDDKTILIHMKTIIFADMGLKSNQKYLDIFTPKCKLTIMLYFLHQVTLKGAKNCVDAAREKINSMIEDLESQVTIECVIEQQHHRYSIA